MELLKNNKSLILSIFAISLPAIIEMALNTLVGIADTIMVSRFISTDAVTAAGNANQLLFTIILIFSSFNIGATAMISRSYGEKNLEKLNRILGQNLFMNTIIGLVITVLSFALGSYVMRIFDTTKEIYNMGVSYLNIVSLSHVFMFISFAAAASLRGVEDTKTPMYITGLVNILNIIGNYLLIKGVGIFPELGIEGAALSTTISRGIGALLYIIFIIRGNDYIKLKIKNLRMSGEVFKPLWNLSSTAAIEQLLMQTSFLAMTVIVSILDKDSEAAFRILLTIESMSFMPAIGFSIAASTLVGKALGEKNIDKALHTGYISTAMGILWGVLIGAVFVVFPSQFPRIFTDEAHIISIIIIPIIFAGLDQPFLAFSIIISGALRGAGDTRTIMILTSIRVWLMFIPLTYVMIKFGGFGIQSVYISEILSLVIYNIITFIRLRNRKWAEIQF